MDPSETKRLTPLKAIRQECLYCMGGSYTLVADCPSIETCHLWLYRLGRRPTTGKHRPLAAIHKHCLDCAGSAPEVRSCSGKLLNGNTCNLHSFRFGKNPSLRGKRNTRAATIASPIIPKEATKQPSLGVFG